MTNKFMVGNWVNEPFPMQVVSVFQDEIYCDFEGNEGDVFDFKNEDVKPIKLTPKVLEKFGLKRHKCGISGADMWQGMDGYSYGDSGWIFRGVTRGGKVTLKVTGFYNSNIEYLHQLQNAAPFLAGEELIYKP